MGLDPSPILMLDPAGAGTERVRALLAAHRGDVAFPLHVVPDIHQAGFILRQKPIALILALFESLNPQDLAKLIEHAPVVVLTSSAVLAESALSAGAADALTWDELTAPLLARVLRHVLKRHSLETALHQQARMIEALRGSEEQFRTIFESSPDAIFVEDPLGTVLDANPAACRLHRMELNELVGKNVLDLVPPEHRESVAQDFPHLATGQSHQAEGYSWTKEGQAIPVELRVSPILFHQAPAVLLHVRETSERKRAENALEERERFIHSIAQATPSIMYVFDVINHCNVYMNREITSQLGYTPEELQALGADFLPTVLHPEDVARLPALLARWDHARDGDVLETEYRIKDVRGEWHYFLGRDTVFQRNEQGRVRLVIGTATDITEKLAATEALRRSDQRFQAFMDHLPALAWVIDGAGNFEYVNRCFQKVTKLPASNLVGSNLRDMVPLEYFDQYQANSRKVLDTGLPIEVLETYPHPDGGLGTILSFKFPVEVADGRRLVGGIGVDITERVRAEEERRRLDQKVQQTQKVESLGILASGIAHEFNNLLTGMLGYADMALLQLSHSSPLRGIVEQIVNSARRAAELTRQMLAYSGKGKFAVKPLDLAETIDEMGHLLKVSISKKALIHYEYAPHLPSLEADPAQLRQVIMNLIINASEAFRGQPGVITVRTSAQFYEPAPFDRNFVNDNQLQGLFVVLEVEDMGCGMTAETLEKLFDPFYTTKFTGRGLGLAAVVGIVRGHHGAIRVRSELGKGSKFQVFFPASAKPPQLGSQDGVPKSTWRGHGLVLLADDEEIVRGLTSTVLGIMGFEVLLARDGQEALSLFREQESNLRLALIDFTMPVLDGVEVFKAIRRQNSQVKVMLASGYNEQVIAARCGDEKPDGFVQKPFRYSDLADALRLALGE